MGVRNRQNPLVVTDGWMWERHATTEIRIPEMVAQGIVRPSKTVLLVLFQARLAFRPWYVATGRLRDWKLAMMATMSLVTVVMKPAR
jgi:hypothetical protein